MRAALALLLSIAGMASSCGRKVQEPEGRPSVTAPAPPGTIAGVAGEVKRGAPAGGGAGRAADGARCVVKTPDTPARGPQARAPACPPDDLRSPPRLRRGKITFPGTRAPELDVEIAENDAQRARGLMFRTELGEREGMLFVYDRPDVHTFWMRNTCIPLDMLFVAEDGFIVGIEENVPVLNEASRGVSCPSLYVLEVPGGWTRRHGVRAGARLVIEGL